MSDKYSWIPFKESEVYAHPHWWDDARGSGVAWFVQVLEAGVEVDHAQLDDSRSINPDYAGVPTLLSRAMVLEHCGCLLPTLMR